MSRQICCLVIALVAVHAAPTAASSIVLIDTFEDGTTQGWGVPGSSSNPPLNQSTGGPDGLDDNFLLVSAIGGSGPGSRLSVINSDQWTFNYLAAGTESISMDLFNFGPQDLYLRLLFADPLGGPPSNLAISSDAIFLAAGSGWTSVVFPIAPADLSALIGSVNGALTSPTELRIFHNSDPQFPGPGAGIPPVNAQLGIDNIQAVVSDVPEPATALLYGIGAAALMWRRHRRSDKR
jgi:hypothetical protein